MKKRDKVKSVLDLYRDGPKVYRILLMGDNGIKVECAMYRDLDGDYAWSSECDRDKVRSDYIRKSLGIPRRYIGENRP